VLHFGFVVDVWQVMGQAGKRDMQEKNDGSERDRGIEKKCTSPVPVLHLKQT